MDLPRETLRALLGHKAAKGKVLSHDGARPVWVDSVSGLAIVAASAPSSPATGQLWYDTVSTC
jgi:hypothetical protein